jgi:hypothetical protein
MLQRIIGSNVNSLTNLGERERERERSQTNTGKTNSVE